MIKMNLKINSSIQKFIMGFQDDRSKTDESVMNSNSRVQYKKNFWKTNRLKIKPVGKTEKLGQQFDYIKWRWW